ncbi:MAG: spermidine synthase, partial [Thermoanaerobaculia bacterium]
MSRAERLSIAVAVTLGGAVLMSLEVAAFRIIGKTFGTALTETTTVIAVFLTAMSIGYYLGGRIA